MGTLQYLLKFLDSYDFSSDGGNEITRDSNRTLINASVLGKVFEKINGYKDGSVYTPSFITMYMCQKAIRPAVVQKFKEKYGWGMQDFGDLKNFITDKRSKKDIVQFNKIIDDMHICDPAVGSGHFLVSALNEMIAIKSELGIFATEDGTRLTDYDIRVADDELVVTDNHGDNFTYLIKNNKPLTEKMQLLQRTLFHEKQKLIENCLFGVDINLNSVNICMLRLWIELLKNAYYKDESNYTELETLPNIDINIKCGNSLLSKFGIKDNLKDAFRKQQYNLDAYKNLVAAYRKSRNSPEKKDLLKVIRTIKEEYTSTLYNRDPRRRKIAELRGQLELVKNNYNLFGQKMEALEQETEEKRIKDLLDNNEKELGDAEQGVAFRDAFEWRFEFPEVLDENGDFIGFDIIIANPPYINVRDIDPKARAIYKQKYATAIDQFDLYILFMEKAFSILSENGYFSFINPDKFLVAKYGIGILQFLSKTSEVIDYWDLSGEIVFKSASVYPVVLTLKNTNNNSGIAFNKSYFEGYGSNLPKVGLEQLLAKIESVKIIKFDCWRPLATSNEIEEGNQSIISNKQISRYKLEPIKNKNTSTHRETDKIKPKILLKKLCYNLEAAIDTKGYIPINTTYIITSKDLDTLKFILGILNSKLLTFYVRTKFIATALRGGYIELRVYQIKELPLILPSLKFQTTITTIVDKIGSAYKKGVSASHLENKLDALIFHIYGLTQEEMNQVLDTIKDLVQIDRDQIEKEYLDLIQEKATNQQ